MRLNVITLKLMLLLLPATATAQGKGGIKTNLLYDATTTINLGIEFRVGERSSLEIPFNYNPWTFSNNVKWKHFLVQPEFRLWTQELFNGHFWGVHTHYALYNIGGLPRPPFSKYMNDHRFEGRLMGVGISWGYRWNISDRWEMEATVGAGYAYQAYDRYPCDRCSRLIGNETKHYFGPTKAGVSLIYSFGKKKEYVTKYEPAQKPIKQPVAPYQPQLKAQFIVPEVEAVKTRNESGKAYIDFAVGQSEIVPNYKNNAAELSRIHLLIHQVVNDPDATITGIVIAGYASPEGSFVSNTILSQRRATSLKDYLASIYGFRENLFTVWGFGEDWATFESFVGSSNMPERYRILEIIRTTENLDKREELVKRLSGGDPYNYMVKTLYPQLRRVEYQLHYTVVPFTVDKGKEIFRIKPNNLSLNEMFLIAETYKPGEDAFNQVFETAARIFPNSDVANINAAASAINRKDIPSAAFYLERVKDRNVAYWNNLGVLLWLQGNTEGAAECFAKGGVQGSENIKELNKHLNN
ncbi:MAG: DUF3575 domain-containing protein [Prevotellaceae bacterium]|nr:DUF3575 domain-containing protein [Prevotellaceae bacterium]